MEAPEESGHDESALQLAHLQPQQPLRLDRAVPFVSSEAYNDVRPQQLPRSAASLALDRSRYTYMDKQLCRHATLSRPQSAMSDGMSSGKLTLAPALQPLLTESGWSGFPFQGARKSQAPSANEIRAPRCPVCPCFPRHHAGEVVIFTGLNLTTSKRNCAGYLCFETSACAVRRRPPREKQDLCCAAAAHAPRSGGSACPSTRRPAAHDPAPDRYTVAVVRGNAAALSDIAAHADLNYFDQWLERLKVQLQQQIGAAAYKLGPRWPVSSSGFQGGNIRQAFFPFSCSSLHMLAGGTRPSEPQCEQEDLSL